MNFQELKNQCWNKFGTSVKVEIAHTWFDKLFLWIGRKFNFEDEIKEIIEENFNRKICPKHPKNLSQ